LGVLAAALLFLAADSAGKLAAFRAATALGEQGRPAPAFAADSPTGYADGRRSQILQSTDGYHWVMQTQQMIATGDWRLRRVGYDNAPHGREVHWCSPLHWWLALVAWADHTATGRPWLVAVESAALYAGPLLLGLFLLGTVPWAARRLGGWPAALLAAGLVAIAPLSGEFGAGSIDHHGVAAGCALLTVLFLAAAVMGPPDYARRGFMASGLAGAAGLWVNAATQIPVLVGLGLGALLVLWLVHAEKNPPFDPRLWRTWGLAGGGAALLFYLVEYFPSHLGWRLEANHPLHALAWAGAGDLLARLSERRKFSLATAGSALAMIAPLLAVLLAPARTFVVADPFLWTLHVDYISEFSPLLSRLDGVEAMLVLVNVLPLAGLAAIGLLWRGGLAPAARAGLALGLMPAALVTLLALSQQRWLHVADALWLAVLAGVALVTTSAGNFPWTPARRIGAGLFLALVLLPYPLRAGLDALRAQSGLSRENIRQFVMRDLAWWLRRRTGTDPVTLLSGPTATTELVYHGGFRGVGTLYWENLAGLRALVEIYGAADPARALELIRARGVTHLVILPWGPFAPESARLARRLRATDPVPAGSFAVDLLESGRGLPDWVRPLPYRLPETEQFKDQFALVLEIAPEQTAAGAAVRRAQFLAAMGDRTAAQEIIRQVLAGNPDQLTALVTLAQFQRSARERSAHHHTVERLRPLLRTDPALEPADRIALALELAAAGIADATYAQVVRCWATLQPPDIRRLPPDTLAVLLQLSRDFKVVPPPELLALAERLSAADRPR